ncbi:MAG TPA: ABC transporter substrate-binding protein, partial [Pirellulaceae bacterium]|nr:ABC transporter substrate-binding protein [Pirellulaceae bacterium]
MEWRHIKQLELFEQMLLADAQKLIAADQLDDAYDALQNLQLNFPKAEGLEAAKQAYLYISAGRLFRQQRWAEALVVLEELHSLNPEYRLTPEARPLPQVYAAVLQKMLEGYLAQGDYRSMRTLLARVSTDFGDQQQATATQWQGKLQQLATAEQTSAKQLAAAGKLREANRACRRMLDIWPDLPGGNELASEVAAQYPIVVVGVTQPAKSLDVRRVDDWAARRAGRLVSTQLLDFLKPGAEGGQYGFPWGSLQLSEDRRQFSLLLRNDPAVTITGYDLAQRLLELSKPDSPDYSPTWASICGGVTVRDVLRVDVDLRHPYVAPEAVLQVPLAQAKAPFVPLAPEGQEAFFSLADRQANAAMPAEITERAYDDQTKVVAALRRGEIDVLDRVFPADVARLSADPSVIVGRYALPTLHYLVPTPGRPLAESRTLRRAMLYAINREAILNEQLLGGKPLAGCRVISGPFSPGTIDNDPLAYAVDAQIAPRPADVRLAATLINLAEKEFAAAAEKSKTKPPVWELVLGYPGSDTARIACQSIAAQLNLVGLPCKLLSLPSGEVRDLKNECDFVYVEVTLGEPVVDARKLLASDGVARLTDPYINLALRRLDAARNWPEARERLKDLHRQVDADLPIIPLWQLVEHHARRAAFVGLTDSPVTLYEDVSAWRPLVAPSAVARQ